MGKFTKLLQSNRSLLKQDAQVNKYRQIEKEIQQLLTKNYSLLTKDYNKYQKFIIKIIGQKDFAVFSYKGIPFMNNIQNARFISLFLNNDTLFGGDLVKFSASTSNFLQILVSEFVNIEEYKDIFNEKVSQEPIDFDMNDYFVLDKKRSDLFINNLDVSQNVFFFNLVCLVNSTNYLYPNVFKLQGPPLHRITFITYLIMIKSLWIYQKEHPSISKALQELIEESDYIFKNDNNRNKFRNHLFHFDLPKNAKWKGDVVNSLVYYYIDMDSDKLNRLSSKAFNVFILEANKMLFGEVKYFLGTNG